VDEVASLALCHPAVISSKFCDLICVMFAGHWSAVRRHHAILSISAGHSNIPFSTWLNTFVEMLASVNNSKSGDHRNGVVATCVKCLPASAKQSCSNLGVILQVWACHMIEALSGGHSCQSLFDHPRIILYLLHATIFFRVFSLLPSDPLPVLQSVALSMFLFSLSHFLGIGMICMPV